jgi:phosphate transport system protein
MTKHFVRDLENLQRELLLLSGEVEEIVAKANRALCERNAELAREVVDSDRAIDLHEVCIEEECLKVLALHQPVAIDLRRVATVLKVNNDLERIADLAVNIAGRAEVLVDYPEFPIPDRIDRMVELATKMVHHALRALVDMDLRAARRVCAADDAVDDLNRAIILELQRLMQERSETVPAALHCFSAARQLERIADHATNIAEDVIYLVNGEIARHRADHDETEDPDHRG